MDEIELKFLNINVKDIKNKLNKIGAKVIYNEMIESFPFLAEVLIDEILIKNF